MKHQTPTGSDSAELRRDIAIEVGIVFKHSKLGTDYTENCTNVILSLAKEYAAAVLTELEKQAIVMSDYSKPNLPIDEELPDEYFKVMAVPLSAIQKARESL